MLTAKEYLSRVAVMQRCINQKCAELEALENTIYNASGIDNSREKVQTSVQNKGFDKEINKNQQNKSNARKIKEYTGR
ncbi:MAG: hypothetical protein IJL89_04435 [Firmicutes bacterium]|nr:hypothetical protein [Bacillota bacterium]